MKKLIIYIKAKETVLLNEDRSLPFITAYENEDYRKLVLEYIKNMYGLKFKGSQLQILDEDLLTCNIGLSLDYYPESYTEKEPLFTTPSKEWYDKLPTLTKMFFCCNY